MRKHMEPFAYNPGLVTGAIALSRHNASIRPGSHEASSRLFPEPRQARLDALAPPETDIRAIEAPALIIHEREYVIVPVDVAYPFSPFLPHSELHVFCDCGHWPQIYQPG